MFDWPGGVDDSRALDGFGRQLQCHFARPCISSTRIYDIPSTYNHPYYPLVTMINN